MTSLRKRSAIEMCLNIDRQLDVVRRNGIDLLRAAEIFAKQLSGGARCLFSGMEIMLHREVDPLNVEKVESIQNSVSAQLLNLSTPQQQKPVWLCHVEQSRDISIFFSESRSEIPRLRSE
ncbi:MAG: hypothetical protein AUG81_12010 [Verrucomicrobia bacterium 13_1_20CM_4_54_11]|nr:MAG: hypothetical protein AUG81_12010 [Verrucomicrobia bacterium 13_1_20CM_4_54_11]